jgi:outer membrane lipoprotein-sorting protein
MTLLRCGLALALALGGGCVAGGPERASDIQNLNAIGDDISAVTMTQSDTSRAKDPNTHSTIPRSYEVSDTP